MARKNRNAHKRKSTRTNWSKLQNQLRELASKKDTDSPNVINLRKRKEKNYNNL